MYFLQWVCKGCSGGSDFELISADIGHWHVGDSEIVHLPACAVFVQAMAPGIVHRLAC